MRTSAVYTLNIKANILWGPKLAWPPWDRSNRCDWNQNAEFYFTLKHPFVGRNGCGLPSRYTCSRPSSDCPAGTRAGWCPPEPFSMWRVLLDQDLTENRTAWVTVTVLMDHRSTTHLFPLRVVSEWSACSGPPAPARRTPPAPWATLYPHVDHQNIHPSPRRRVYPTARGCSGKRLQLLMSQEMMARAQHKWSFSNSLLSYLSEQLRPKEARTREDAWLCQPGLPEPFASSAVHLKKWQQLRPFDSIKINLAVMCSSLLAAYWPNGTMTANNSWLHSERLCCIRRGKKEGVTAAALQFYQYLCCKEWHLQLFHNYLAGFAAIHLQNCCYDRWRASSTITRTPWNTLISLHSICLHSFQKP